MIKIISVKQGVYMTCHFASDLVLGEHRRRWTNVGQRVVSAGSTISSLGLQLSSSSTTSRELLSHLSACSG